MERGFFKVLAGGDEYNDSDKNWIVELSQSCMIWYDSIVNKNDAGGGFDTRRLAIERIRRFKQEVSGNLEKRFIYFICTRPKVRFNTQVLPALITVSGNCAVYFNVRGETKAVYLRFLDPDSEMPYKPKFEVTEKYITIVEINGDRYTYSVHDFFSIFRIDIGFGTNVEYVGITRNPDKRPLNGQHSELSHVIYKALPQDNDVLIYYNVLKVSVQALHAEKGVGFLFANAMIDEIDVELEGKILEKCFIEYFDSSNQLENKDKERAELRNNLTKLARDNRINSILVNYEFGLDTEYWHFSSSSRSINRKHTFIVRLRGEAPIVSAVDIGELNPFIYGIPDWL